MGKIRKRWLRKTVGDIGVGAMQAIKQYIDPNNIFGNNNLMIGQSLAGTVKPEIQNVHLPSKLWNFLYVYTFFTWAIHLIVQQHVFYFQTWVTIPP